MERRCSGERGFRSTPSCNLEVALTLDEFLDNFPTVSREHAIAVLEFYRATIKKLGQAPSNVLLDEAAPHVRSNQVAAVAKLRPELKRTRATLSRRSGENWRCRRGASRP